MGVQESTYGSFVFQGAFVYHVSNSAFELRGAISHSDAVVRASAAPVFARVWYRVSSPFVWVCV